MPKPSPKPSGDSPAIDKCVAVFRRNMHMPDTSPLFAALGSIAANYLAGTPVWLMLVSPPSSGKTQIINSCLTLPFCREAGQCKNSAAFLTHDKQRGTGGILSPPLKDTEGCEIGGIGEFGILFYPEFSTILGLNPDQREEVLSIHRQIYDGRCVRQYGASGGRVLEWSGKCGALGAVTTAIDENPSSGDLGERWMYYRFPPSDLRAQATAVMNMEKADPKFVRAEFVEAVQNVFTACGIKPGDEGREFTEKEKIHFADITPIACKLRGTVRRDRYTRDITSSPQIEGTGRITHSLKAMYLGLERLGLGKGWCWKIVRKIALDSAPALRMEILKAISHIQYLGEEPTTTMVTSLLKVSRKTGERHLEDLDKLDIVHKLHGDGNAAIWDIDKDVKWLMAKIEKED